MRNIEDYKKIIGSNIQELDGRLATSHEQRQISIAMLCKRVAEERGEGRIAFAYREICECLGTPDRKDKARVCACLADCRTAGVLTEIDLFGEGEAAAAGTQGRIAYVRNRRNDDAFMAFSECVKGARAHYTPSFSEACEAVVDNKCEFCILPIENDKDGKLYSFYAMLDRYELKIRDTAEILSEDESETTVFALVGRSVSAVRRTDGALRFEFSVVGESANVIGEILEAAECLGASVSSVGTQPVPYDGRSMRIYFAVDLNDTSPIPIAMYLCMEHNGYTPLGLYKT